MSGLSGAGVLVTRPEPQAHPLAAAIERAGGLAISFPVMEIEGRDRAVLEREHESLPVPDIALFISANAVAYGLDLFDADVQIGAIGPATRDAIEAAGRLVDIYPQSGFDSEHLLREASLRNVQGRSIRIVRADTGRELLADTLRRRGAQVDYLSVYRRLPRRTSDAELAALEGRWRAGSVHFIIVMSVATLDNLLSILPDHCRATLSSALLVTPSARVIQTAGERIPAVRAILSPGPQADDMVRAMTSALEKGQ